MTTLLKGVKIHFATDCNTTDRIKLSNGSVAARNISEESYEEEASIPSPDWHEPSALENEMLLADEFDPDYTKTIGIIKLPDSLIDLLKKFNLSHVTSITELRDKISQDSSLFEMIKTGFKNVIDHHSFVENGYVIHDILVNDGNRLTTTINLDNGKFTGLHIDFWDGLKLNQIEDARNRISFNLGEEPRYFTFINKTVVQLHAELQSHFGNEHFNQDKLLKHFLKNNPDYPIVKVKVEPYEAYIAPTENLIHDGSTLGSKHKDIQLFTRGYFSIRKLEDIAETTNNK